MSYLHFRIERIRFTPLYNVLLLKIPFAVLINASEAQNVLKIILPYRIHTLTSVLTFLFQKKIT